MKSMFTMILAAVLCLALIGCESDRQHVRPPCTPSIGQQETQKPGITQAERHSETVIETVEEEKIVVE